jgi:hypothetical protein
MGRIGENKDFQPVTKPIRDEYMRKPGKKMP